MNDATAQVREMLRERGHSVTAQRLAVFDALLGQEPMSMAEIYDRVEGVAERTSVYRTIRLFEEIDVVRRVDIGWKHRFELSGHFVEHHHHMVCLGCQRITAITGAQLERFIERLADEHRFQATGHQVEIEGYCEECRRRRAHAAAMQSA